VKHTSTTIEELFLLCGSFRDVINNGQDQLVVSSVLESAKRVLEPEAEK
jgi:hypothetical protein